MEPSTTQQLITFIATITVTAAIMAARIAIRERRLRRLIKDQGPQLKSICYLAGPMTGIPDWNKPAFRQAIKRLTDKGWTVLSTVDMPIGLQHHEYLIIAYAMIKVADVMVMLPGWSDSAGAVAERQFALERGVLVRDYREILDRRTS
jgi:hypothetical protein